MSEPYLGEIKLMSFNFPPKGWALCNGQLLPINQNQALFSLLGTTYGGDGRVNFALPDLRSRVPIHFGGGHNLGERGGEENHTLSQAEIPTHVHTWQATSAPALADNNGFNPAGNVLAQAPATDPIYTAPNNPLSGMAAGVVANAGGSQPHPNMQPSLVLSFCIALQGVFPSPN